MTDETRQSPAQAVSHAGDYFAWLIEIQEAAGPTYFQMVDDDDWTKSHDLALHFCRERDAQRVIEFFGWTRARAVEHCWPAPAAPDVIAESNGHHWIKAFNLLCCRDCGIVRRADDQNRPCKGLVGVALRNRQPTDAPSFPVPTSSLEAAQMRGAKRRREQLTPCHRPEGDR